MFVAQLIVQDRFFPPHFVGIAASTRWCECVCGFSPAHVDHHCIRIIQQIIDQNLPKFFL